jgi:hypothetical protein
MAFPVKAYQISLMDFLSMRNKKAKGIPLGFLAVSKFSMPQTPSRIHLCFEV